MLEPGVPEEVPAPPSSPCREAPTSPTRSPTTISLPHTTRLTSPAPLPRNRADRHASQRVAAWLAGIQYAERAEPILAVDSGLLALEAIPSDAIPPGPILDAMQAIAQHSPEADLLFGVTAYFLCLNRIVNDIGPGGICEPSWPGGLDDSRPPASSRCRKSYTLCNTMDRIGSATDYGMPS